MTQTPSDQNESEILGQGSYSAYTAGFIFSAALSLLAYLLVTHNSFSARQLLVSISFLAILQLIVQLVCFLHFGKRSLPRWNLIVFGFMLTVVLILVFGSLWIMYNLNYNHGHIHTETPQQIIKDEGITP